MLLIIAYLFRNGIKCLDPWGIIKQNENRPVDSVMRCTFLKKIKIKVISQPTKIIVFEILWHLIDFTTCSCNDFFSDLAWILKSSTEGSWNHTSHLDALASYFTKRKDYWFCHIRERQIIRMAMCIKDRKYIHYSESVLEAKSVMMSRRHSTHGMPQTQEWPNFRRKSQLCIRNPEQNLF